MRKQFFLIFNESIYSKPDAVFIQEFYIYIVYKILKSMLKELNKETMRKKKKF